MAIQKCIVSFSVLDADGDRASLPIYGSFDDASATLSSLASWAAARAAQLDPIIDGQIVNEAITIYPVLPGGLKGAPVAGSDVEKGGLLTWNLSVTPTRAYGQELPAFKVSKFVGDLVNVSDADVAAWITGLSSPFGTVTPTGDQFAYPFQSVRKAVKSFRKIGK